MEALSLWVRRTDDALAGLAFLDVAGRPAKRLLTPAAARPNGDWRMWIIQAALASMLGVSRERVNKQLNEFAQRGWISLYRGRITLIDAEGLRSAL